MNCLMGRREPQQAKSPMCLEGFEIFIDCFAVLIYSLEKLSCCYLLVCSEVYQIPQED